MKRGPRSSTAVLSVCFAAVLTTYLLVRPAPERIPGPPTYVGHIHIHHIGIHRPGRHHHAPALGAAVVHHGLHERHFIERGADSCPRPRLVKASDRVVTGTSCARVGVTDGAPHRPRHPNLGAALDHPAVGSAASPVGGLDGRRHSKPVRNATGVKAISTPGSPGYSTRHRGPVQCGKDLRPYLPDCRQLS